MIAHEKNDNNSLTSKSPILKINVHMHTFACKSNNKSVICKLLTKVIIVQMCSILWVIFG